MKGVELTWRGGEHSFALTIDLLKALQQKCDAGPEFILTRLSTRKWLVEDVIETIRLALEGGGLHKEEARRLVRIHVEDVPLTESVMTAQAVLMAALYGSEDDMPGELKAGEESKIEPRSREENGGSPASINGQA
ncbi:hypothetical protein D3C71_931580 [compost metagenome]